MKSNKAQNIAPATSLRAVFALRTFGVSSIFVDFRIVIIGITLGQEVVIFGRRVGTNVISSDNWLREWVFELRSARIITSFRSVWSE